MKINLNNASLKISAGLVKQFPANPVPQICFSGRSNVGKSSLMNILLNRKALARVSSTPGKTITINFYDIDSKLYLVDLPGYGYAKRTYQEKVKWSSLVNDFFVKNPNFDLLKLVVQLVDGRIGPTEDDLDMIEFMNNSHIPYVIVSTKTDKLNATGRKKCVEKLVSCPYLAPGTKIILFSSTSKEGRLDVWNAISDAIDEPINGV